MIGPTVGELLRMGIARLRESGSDSARLDAELLLGHVLRTDRASLIAHTEAPIGTGQQEAYEALLVRRAAGEPVAYIRGIKEFYSLALSVDARALIPRPETELLVDLSLERLRSCLLDRARPAGSPPVRLWDVGTGSGAIAVALAVECRRRGYASDVRITATDLSADALALAAENAVAHGVADIIDFATADLLGLPKAPPADVLAANLPYVRRDEVPLLPVAASFEPVPALDGGPDGLVHLRRLLGQLPDGLAAGGVALLEIGSNQADEVRAAAAERLPGWPVSLHNDLAGLPRVVELRRSNAAT